MSAAIVVEELSKRFRRYHAKRPTTFQEALRFGLRGLRPTDYFWVLRDIDFHINTGTMVGLIGPNGAGKSTLLRMIGGVGLPDRGRVQVQGRIGALLDLGAGFHPELTGRENVFVSGVISGLTRQEIRARFDSIVAFSELEMFIDSPLRVYSSGMQMRLAFAVAAHIEPEVLLIDEVLAVGDLAFQRKCLDRVSEFKRRGCTIVLVSHDTSFVRDLCDEALWLQAGELVAQGRAATVTDAYIANMMATSRHQLSSEETHTDVERTGDAPEPDDLNLELTSSA